MRTHHLGKTPGTGQSRRTADFAATSAPRMAASVSRYAVDNVLPSPGQPLAAPLKEEMEARLSADFSRVPVHTDSAAHDSATAVGVRAYTSGPHVVIGPGTPDKHTLTHVPAPVQRSTVHDVLRGSGQPLAEPLKEEMQARLGADFSHVRVHTDSAARASAAGVGARAYTSGSHVVIGYGGADKHILAHELTHVIQQRSGPVAGTDTGAGLRVSDPSDRFERQAAANASRVMAMGVADRVGPAVHGSAAQSQPSVSTVTTVPTVQRGILDQLGAIVRVPLIRQDPTPPGQPRQDSIDHINKTLEDAGVANQETVGSGVAAAIGAIQLPIGEHGARDVHTVFTDPSLTELYKIKKGEPGFQEAHEKIAATELEYWERQHATNPSAGTQVAAGVNVRTRVELQKNMGSARTLAQRWLETAGSTSSPFE